MCMSALCVRLYAMHTVTLYCDSTVCESALINSSIMCISFTVENHIHRNLMAHKYSPLALKVMVKPEPIDYRRAFRLKWKRDKYG